MLIGTYYHTLEAGGRVSLPKSFRQQAQKWVITRGLDGGLFLFPTKDFQTRLQAVSQTHEFTKKANRDFVRLMTNEAQEISADKSGRVKLPSYLTAYAGLKKDLVVVGSLEYIELWNRDTYHKYLDSLEKNAESIAEQL
ncbi:MAG: division/cell wall cluster transcriptional repressor MraZ [Candidatus Paceibacterota bacterium]